MKLSKSDAPQLLFRHPLTNKLRPHPRDLDNLVILPYKMSAVGRIIQILTVPIRPQGTPNPLMGNPTALKGDFEDPHISLYGSP
jgi:hypothetical protein